MARPLEFVKQESVSAVCPHCEKELKEIHYKSKGFPIWFGNKNMYFCPHCRKVLGFSQSRMA